MSLNPKHPSDSSEQRSAEAEILAALQRQWNVSLDDPWNREPRIDLDGFADIEEPICVKVWAHQGRAKGGQFGKVMRDFCKLLLAERVLEKRCKKIFAVSDENAISFLKNSWQGRFAEEFAIECDVVTISDNTRQQVRNAQSRQVQ